MINEKMEKALNVQVNREFYSSYLYLQMASYFAQKGLNGFANWMKVQAEEESFHAHKFFDYILERGGKVELLEIEKPICEFESVLDVFEKTLKHEVYITSCINSLMDVAEEIRDRAAVSFLQWFLEEQIEEESTAENIIAQLKLAEGCSKDILFMLDKEMASRTFSKPQ